MDYPSKVKKQLWNLISEMGEKSWLFSRNPDKDFSRKKKWDFESIMKFMITMEGKTLKHELFKYFDYHVDTPTTSSFNQRRAQILPLAFEFLFHYFSELGSDVNHKHKGYRLLACDGSDLNIAHNPNDETTYFCSASESKGFNQLHLNALYDLCARTYVDAMIQPGRLMNEYRAMCDMIDRYTGDRNTIFIADRGYGLYNIFAHAEKKKV